MPTLVDSHCHLHLMDLPDNPAIDAVVEEAQANGVGTMLCVGTKLSDAPLLQEFTQRYASVFASVGLHPNEVVEKEPGVEELVKLASNPKVLAIGETGLDYYRDTVEKGVQELRFRNHIQASQKLNKPLIIHTRMAAEDTLRILREEGAGKVSGVFHCFTENWDTAVAALDLGFYISFSGIVTFKNAVDLQDIAKRLPINKILIETDAPYLAPVPYRGQMNKPAYVKHVAEFLAALRVMNFDAFAEHTTENFHRLMPER